MYASSTLFISSEVDIYSDKSEDLQIILYRFFFFLTANSYLFHFSLLLIFARVVERIVMFYSLIEENPDLEIS